MTENSVFRRRPNHAPDTLPAPEHWGKHAACRKASADVFYPEDFSGAEAVAAAETAKRYCRACPVVGPCLTEALDQREQFGVWGGTTAPERRAYVRRQREEANRAEAEGVATEAA